MKMITQPFYIVNGPHSTYIIKMRMWDTFWCAILKTFSSNTYKYLLENVIFKNALQMRRDTSICTERKTLLMFLLHNSTITFQHTAVYQKKKIQTFFAVRQRASEEKMVLKYHIIHTVIKVCIKMIWFNSSLVIVLLKHRAAFCN